MAKGMYSVIGGKTKKGKKAYTVVSGVTKKVKKAYVVLDGKTKLAWSGGGKFLLATTGGAFSESDDGMTWKRISSTSVNLRNLTYGNETWAAPTYTSGSRVIYSKDDGYTWTASNISESALNLDDLAYGNGVWLTVGYNASAENDSQGRMYKSTDNMATWARVYKFTGEAPGTVYFMNGKFIVPYDGNTYYSTDGETWTTGGSYSGAIAYGNGMYMLNKQTMLVKSTDLITWTATAGRTVSGESMDTICFGAGKFVMTGDFDGTAWDSTSYYTTDGAVLTKGSKLDMVSGGSTTTFGNGTFVNANYQGMPCYTKDGINWEPVRGLRRYTASPGCYVIDRFYTIGSSLPRNVYTSLDGINWTHNNATVFSGGAVKAIGEAFGKVYAFGNTGTAGYSSDKGNTWTMMTGASTTSHYGGFATNGTILVAVHSGGRAAYSTDGTTLSSYGVYDGALRDVEYGNGKFITHADSRMYYSTTGTDSWTTVTGAGSYIGAIAYGNNKWVAASSTALYYSSDGITWTKSTTTVTITFDVIEYLNNKFVAVGSSGNSIYSTDGVTWTTMSGLSTDTSYYNVMYGAGKYVVIGGNAGMSYYSTNGTSWTRMDTVAYGGWKVAFTGPDGIGIE